ncbi:hypothetical protein G6F68_010635 [Rhizopus microsporus]|nr:hypothetical protein G6F68_010635 [Rhizopus microsporus]
MFDDDVQQRRHAEVVHARTEEHRGLLAGAVRVQVEGVAGALHQFEFVAQVGQHLRTDLLGQAGGIDGREDGRVLAGEVAARFVQVHFAGQQVHHALQALAHADRPGDRGALDAEHGFHFVQQLDRVLALAVELVDEGHDRGVAQAAHFHQLDGALFHALGHVDHHQRRVHRGQHAVGVLAEVGVAGGVDDVDPVLDAGLLVFPGDGGVLGQDGDAAFLFLVVAVHHALGEDGALGQGAGLLQELVDQGGLAMVDVGDDGDVAKIFDGHTKGGQSAPDLEKEVQHYTSNLTIREKVDFTPVMGPIQLGPAAAVEAAWRRWLGCPSGG